MSSLTGIANDRGDSGDDAAMHLVQSLGCEFIVDYIKRCAELSINHSSVKFALATWAMQVFVLNAPGDSCHETLIRAKELLDQHIQDIAKAN